MEAGKGLDQWLARSKGTACREPRAQDERRRGPGPGPAGVVILLAPPSCCVIGASPLLAATAPWGVALGAPVPWPWAGMRAGGPCLAGQGSGASGRLVLCFFVLDLACGRLLSCTGV